MSEDGPVTVTRRLRRHRDGAALPAHVVPADIPDDADGRVMFFAVSPDPDVLPGDVGELKAPPVVVIAEPLGQMGAAITAMTRAPMRLFMRGGIAGWAPVGLLAIIFVVVFLVGMRLAK